MTTAEAVALSLQAGLPVVLQRVARATSAQGFVHELQALLGTPCAVVQAPIDRAPVGVRVLDARQASRDTFLAWDHQRARLGDASSPLVVLLDAASGRTLLQVAPHLSSWAGGVRLPVEPLVRTARSDQELRLGQNALRRVLHERPELRQEDAPIGVVLGSDRVFVGLPEVSPLAQARDELDEGTVYVTRIAEEENL